MTLLTPEQCKTKRKARGLSQAELSRRADLSDNYVCRFESGVIREPSGAKLQRLEKALKKTPISPEVATEVQRQLQTLSEKAND